MTLRHSTLKNHFAKNKLNFSSNTRILLIIYFHQELLIFPLPLIIKFIILMFTAIISSI